MIDSNIIKVLFLLVCLPMLTVPLRATTDPFPPYYSASQYKDSLANTQASFEESINDLNIQIQEINDIIQDTTTSKGLKITKISEEMADERDELYSMEQNLKIPFNLKSCDCKEITPEAKQAINDKIESISATISNLKLQISDCQEQVCPKYQQLLTEIKHLNGYIDVIDSTVNSDCCRSKYKFVEQKATGFVEIQNALKKDNLQAKNWYFSQGGEQKYRLKIFELTSKFNTVTCPIDKPFVNTTTNKCFQCEHPLALFNLNEQKCYHCSGAHEYLNKSISKCETCPQHHYFNQTLSRCASCPDHQYLNNQTYKCQACNESIGEYLNIQEYKCQKCPEEQAYNIVIEKCEPCDTDHGSFLNPATFKCERCPLNHFYSVADKKCQQCKGESYFDQELGICTFCPEGSQLNKQTIKCEECSNTTHYKITMKRCIECQEGTVFNKTSQVCEKSNTNTTNMTGDKVGSGTNQEQNPCPKNYPFYNKYSRRCEACLSNQIYHPQKGICIRNNNIGLCPPDKPVYNFSSFMCQECPEGETYNQYTYNCEKSD